MDFLRSFFLPIYKQEFGTDNFKWFFGLFEFTLNGLCNHSCIGSFKHVLFCDYKQDVRIIAVLQLLLKKICKYVYSVWHIFNYHNVHA